MDSRMTAYVDRVWFWRYSKSRYDKPGKIKKMAFRTFGRKRKERRLDHDRDGWK